MARSEHWCRQFLRPARLYVQTDPAGFGRRLPLLFKGVSKAEPTKPRAAEREERVPRHPHPVTLAEELAPARMPIAVLDMLASFRLAPWAPSMRLGHSGSRESRHCLITNYFRARPGGVRWCVVAGDERRRTAADIVRS